MSRPDRPKPPLRWVRSPWGGGRVAEYRALDVGPCVGCGQPASWIWIGECAELRRAIGAAILRRWPIGYALQVSGVDRCGRVTCSDCRGETS